MPKLLETLRDTPNARNPVMRSAISAASQMAIGWVAIALLAGDLRAQFLEPDPAFKNKKSDVVKILREDKSIPPADQQMFDDFFRLYAIPQFAAKENLIPKKETKAESKSEIKKYVSSGLPKVRYEFRTNYFTQAPGANGPPHQRANQLTLEKFKEILRTKVPADSPTDLQGQVAAIKVNVVLAIGEMNEQESGGNLKPKPLPQALTMLLAIFNAKAAEGKLLGASDALRFAALVGIQRHAESDALPPESRASIQQAMLTMVKQKQPPEGRELTIQNALRRRAAATLGMLDDVGPNGAVVKVLEGVVGDASEPAKVRAEFAAALGTFKVTPDAPIDFKGLANRIGWLLIDVGRPEATTAGEKEEPAAWRRFRSCLRDGLEGLTLAATVTDPNQKQFVDGIVAKAKLMDKTLDNPKNTLDNATLAKKVSDQLKELEAVLEPRAIAPKAPDARPVAPAIPPKKPGREASAVGNKPPRPARATQVSVDKRAADGKTDGDKASQEIEGPADEDEKPADR
jgi:hypothetical protein